MLSAVMVACVIATSSTSEVQLPSRPPEGAAFGRHTHSDVSTPPHDVIDDVSFPPVGANRSGTRRERSADGKSGGGYLRMKSKYRTNQHDEGEDGYSNEYRVLERVLDKEDDLDEVRSQHDSRSAG